LPKNPQIAGKGLAPSTSAGKTDERCKRPQGGLPMAIHLTPTELARESGMHRREVITKCMQMGVPIFEGRIDKTLFMATLKDEVRIAQPQIAKA
jgi:hypothetical protein